MKQLTTISCLLFMFLLFSTQNADAQIQVSIGVGHPSRRVVVVERPVCPGPDYAWIEGHYIYDSYSRRDVWVPAQWVYIEPQCPPRRYEREEHHHHGRGRDYAPGQRKKRDGRYYN